MMLTKQRGGFCLSLDFELMWGVRDTRTTENYGANILGVRDVVPRLLERFAARGIAGTWATVGFLFFDDRDALLAALPDVRPMYQDKRLSPYEPAVLAALGASERKDPYHYGLSLLRQIKTAPNQEIATHTFSHYYCLEPGQDVRTFGADLEAACRAAASLDITLQSIVFPRNQFNADYLAVCRGYGLSAYRGNERSMLYAPTPRRSQRMLTRAARFFDSYVDLSGPNIHDVRSGSDLANVPASRFLRPCARRLALLDGARLGRIRKAMRLAAHTGKVFHLWFHPHNFGTMQDENFAVLDEILTEVNRLRDEYGWPSCTMAQLACS